MNTIPEGYDGNEIQEGDRMDAETVKRIEAETGWERRVETHGLPGQRTELAYWVSSIDVADDVEGRIDLMCHQMEDGWWGWNAEYSENGTYVDATAITILDAISEAEEAGDLLRDDIELEMC